MNKARLLQILEDNFNLGELDRLCFDLEVKFENLSGGTLSEKAQALVSHLDQRGRLRDLERAIAEQRPNLRLVAKPGERVPYLGLQTFQPQHADLFFGRERLVEALVQRAATAPFLAVLGPSGSGKSSVVLAGLLPALQRGAVTGSEAWRYLTLKPGARPLDALAATLATLQGQDLSAALALRQALAADERALGMAADMLRTRLVLVVDQFEELWTQAPTEPEARRAFAEAEQRPFLQLLLAASVVASQPAPVLVILTMRADFLHRAAEYPELARAIGDHDVIVSPMQADELRRAIEQPARAAGGQFEPGLVDELVTQVQERVGALPLLEYTLLELWKARQSDGALGWTAYRALGGVEGALAARADAILETHYPTPAQRDALRQLLLRLVQPGQGATDTRRRVRLADLVPAGATTDTVQTLLKPLADERLLTTGRDPATRAETVELSHEALIRAWPTFRRWIDEAREDLALQLQLEEAARGWEANDDNPGFLWRDLPLARAEAWLLRTQPSLNRRDRDFLDASQQAEQARQAAEETARQEKATLEQSRVAAQSRARLFRNFSALAAILLLVAIALAAFAQQQRNEAVAQAIAAEQARADAEVARGEAVTQADAAERSRVDAEEARAEAIIQANAAEQARADAEAARGEAITQANAAEQARADAEAARTEVELLARAGEALFELSRNNQDRAPLLALAALPTDTTSLPLLVSRALRDTVDKTRVRRVFEDSASVEAVAWSPDGRQVLTRNFFTTRVWDVTSGQAITQLEGHTGFVAAVAWSPDGRQVLTGGDDGTARVWDVASGQTVTLFEGHTNSVEAVAWSPDGRQVLPGGGDSTARVWDVASASGQTVTLLEGHTGRVLSVAWSPDGRRVLTGGDDGTRVWDVTSGQTITVLEGHTGGVSSVAWSSDGRQVLTGSGDSTARVWDMASGQTVTLFEGHTRGISSVAWSPDGRQVLTGSYDGTARVWNVASEQTVTLLEGQTDRVLSVAWSPDGRQVLTGGGDDTGRVWNVASRQTVTLLEGHMNWVQSVVWSPDGRRVLTGSYDGTARVWDVVSGQTVTLLEGHTRGVLSVAWSPDGRQLLTGSLDGTARVWDVASGQTVTLLEGHTGTVSSVAWSPDGRQVLTGDSYDGTARLWDIASGQTVTLLEGHTGFVSSVAWSPDGRQVLTGSDDGTARVWDVASGQTVALLKGHTSLVAVVAWSPDGRQVLTGSYDGTARVGCGERGVRHPP